MAELVGADGLQSVEIYTTYGGGADACCPPSICSIDPCGLVCNFITLLPSGPLWDRPKAEALRYVTSSCNPLDGGLISCLPPDDACSSLVTHAVYTAKRFYDTLMSSLAPALRESSPYTAFDTVDDWLVRLGWVDCFKTACRSCDLGELLTPYEIDTPCGPEYVEPVLPEALECAYKHGIVTALSRANMGVIKNLEGVNWVIAPLGAVLTRDTGACDAEGEIQLDCKYRYKISPLSDQLPNCFRPECPPTSESQDKAARTIDAFYYSGGGGKVYPLVLAALCIAKSLLPNNGLAAIRWDWPV